MKKQINNLSELKNYNLVATFNADPFAVETEHQLQDVIEALGEGYRIYDKEDEQFEELAELLDGDIETYEYIYSNVHVTVGFLK